MSITAAVCNSFVNELGQGLHDTTVTTGDTYKIALYKSTASLSAATTVFTVVGEITGTGYTTGGETLTNVTPTLSGSTSLYDWADVTFSAVTLSGVAGAMIYNSTNGNRAVAVLKFSSEQSPSAQDLQIEFPAVSVTTAIVRITNNG